jgi:NADH dehydrogenase [ubiquinone] 1 alpha subcomplex assembly factor 5
VFRPYAKISPDTPPPQTPYEVFDEPSKYRQRDRVLLRLRENIGVGREEVINNLDGEGMGVVDYLRDELAERLVERVEVCP